MDEVTLGRSGLRVSRIAFGTWQLGGEWGEFDERKAIAAIRHARELGVTLFDTAQGYGFGASEQLLGRALRDDLNKRRDEVAIATKGGLRMSHDGMVRDSSPAFLRRGVEESLRSLGVDSASPTTTRPRWPSSHARARWRRCNRPTTCSAATSSRRFFPTHASTTSGCSSTGRSPTGC